MATPGTEGVKGEVRGGGIRTKELTMIRSSGEWAGRRWWRQAVVTVVGGRRREDVSQGVFQYPVFGKGRL